MRGFTKWLTASVGVAVLSGAVMAGAGVAGAAPQESTGREVRPGQTYDAQPQPRDWLGSYTVQGRQVWCVEFALAEPDTAETYVPGGALTTKWGTPVSDSVSAQASYLLLRYGQTRSPDEAAAVSHLLHSWTAAPRKPSDLDPRNDAETIAYDAGWHYAKLPSSTRSAVQRLEAESRANRGPWQAEMTAPEEPQTIGRAATWSLRIQRPSGHAVPGVPVKLAATDAKIEGVPDEGGSLTTPEDGRPLTLTVTPTGPRPHVVGSLLAPAAHPLVQQALHSPAKTQRVVGTGGEQPLTAEASTTAVAGPATLQVLKTDSQTRHPIAGVPMRVTGTGGGPAVRQDGSPLQGADGGPAIVVTDRNGEITVADLRAPQEVAVTEVTPAPGYDTTFDPRHPPRVVGTLEPGQTTRLVLTNVANAPTVPVRIPAGNPTSATQDGTLYDQTTFWAAVVSTVSGVGLLGRWIRVRQQRGTGQ